VTTAVPSRSGDGSAWSPASGDGSAWSSTRAFGASISAEWLKVTTVRSSYITLVVSLAAMVGVSAIVCASNVSSFDKLGLLERTVFKLTFDPAFSGVSGVFLAQLGVGVLGVLTMTSEYSSGMIRTSLAAVPRRLHLLMAKAIVYLVIALVVGLVGSFCSFLVGQSILSGAGLSTSLSAPGVPRVVIGGGLYLAVLGLLGVGLGAMIRRTAGAVAALFGLLLVLPAIAAALPSPWGPDVSRYLPNEAGSALLHLTDRTDVLAPWTGFAVFAAYAVVAMVLGSTLLLRRDA
jgi:ABC-2 type transport system permease protein